MLKILLSSLFLALSVGAANAVISNDAACTEYAKKAVALSARIKQCDQGARAAATAQSPSFSDDLKAHHDWCMTIVATPDGIHADQEQTKRQVLADFLCGQK